MLNGKQPFQYQNIARTLEVSIRDRKFPAGSRIPSEPELASHFGVNRRTVRRALLDLERAGRLIRRQGQGTFVAEAGNRSRDLLYIGDMEDHFFKERFLILHGQAQACGRRLFGVMPAANGNRDWKEHLGAQIEQVAAVIVQGSYCDQVAPYLAKAGAKVALIVIGDSKPTMTVGRPMYYVLTDLSRATTIGMEHLLSLGHRRIALLTLKEIGPAIIKTPSLGYEPMYRSSLLKHGICQWEMVLPIDTNIPMERNDTFKQLKKALASKNRPTAFLCDMDYRARFLYNAAAELGLAIPRDISVVGVYDTPWCQAWTPELTSVNLGHEELAEVVMRFCEGGPAGRDIVCRIEPHLVSRQSCAGPKEVEPARRNRA